MPVANVRWLGELPQQSVAKTLLEMLEIVTWEEVDEYSAVASYQVNGPDKEKVLICQEQVYLCIWQNGVLLIVPDSALNFTTLVDMQTHEICNLSRLTLKNVIEMMSK